MIDVCFAAAEGFAGCITSCRNAAAVLGGTWTVIPRRGPTPAAALDAGLLVLSSWSERYESILGERRGPIVPRWHSTILETELSQEAAKLARIVGLLDQRRFPLIAVNDIEFVKVLGRQGIIFLPDVLDQNDYREVAATPLMGVNVSLFGAGHWRKNIVVQSAAFDRARREIGVMRWTLHLNGQTVRDEAYGLWLKAAGIPFVDHGRLGPQTYLALIAGMDAGLCATFSESYCYVAADHVALRVPIVASSGIACLGNCGGRTRPDDINEIAHTLSRVIDDRDAVSLEQYRSLGEQARINARIARSALREMLGLTTEAAQ